MTLVMQGYGIGFHDVRHNSDWSGTPLGGRAEPCRGAFTGCRLCRRPPKPDFRIFGFFDWLVHPQSGLLCGAALPFCFCFSYVTFEKNMIFDDFSMIVHQNDYNLSSNRGTTYKTSILDPIEFWWVA